MKKKYEERYARQIAGEKEFFCGRFELDSGKFLETLQKFKMIVDFSERMEKTPGPSIICELDQGTMHVRTNGAISNAGMAAAKELIRQGAYDAGVVVNTHETPVSYIGVPLGYSSMYVTLRFLEASEIDASADLAGELAGKMEIGIDFGALDLCPTKKPNLSRVQGGQLYFLLTEARNHFLIDRIVPHAKGDNLVLSAYCSEHEDYLEAYGKDFAWRIAVLKEKARFTNCTVREADKKDGHFLDIIVPCKSSTVK
ncbi:MAG: hypothetical protein NT051_05315, partial [Candidatus Micrarchaeota archaeon]|nr:hypothetical protein [Candidatus Micrarchaeota archaeon]